MAHEIHDDGFHEIQLSGKQLVFLFMATTVVSIVIFLCGVLVGRGVQYARGGVPGAAGLVSDAADGGDDDAAAAPASGEPTPVAGLSYPESLPARDGAPAPVVAGAARDLGKAPSSGAPAAPRRRGAASASPAAGGRQGVPEGSARAEASRLRRRPRRRRPRLPPRTAASPCR